MNAKKTRDRLRQGFFGRLLLGSLSILYVSVIMLRRWLYKSGLLSSRRLPVPVVCFGNLSAGGTGKTSTVVAAAQELKAAGRKPAILIRGYKRKAPADRLTVLTEGAEFSAEEAGDEAVMLFKMLKETGVPVLVSSDRYRSGLAAIERFGSDILLMDDGFQFFRLERDLNILLVNATSPFHRDSLLPLGDLREPPSALRRGHAVIITHCEHAEQAAVDEISFRVRAICPGVPVLESEHTPKAYLNALTKEAAALTRFRGKKVVALSGIGDPGSFEDTLKALKATPSQIWRYPDHHRFTRAELSAVQETRGGLPLITTYKDFARFPEGWEEILGNGVFILSVEIEFREAGRETLMKLISGAGAAK
jgi:tetraacyldisaccharide 4'-kinase